MRDIIEIALQDIAQSWQSIPWEWRIHEFDHPETERAGVEIHVNPNKAGEHLLVAAHAPTLELSYKILVIWMVTEGIQIKYEDRVVPRITGAIQDEPPKDWPHNWLHAMKLNQEAHERL